MITRKSQLQYLELLKKYSKAEAMTISNINLLHKSIKNPIYIIDVFKLFHKIKRKRASEMWYIEEVELKIFFEDLKLNFSTEELLPIIFQISKDQKVLTDIFKSKKNRDGKETCYELLKRFSFENFLDFMLPISIFSKRKSHLSKLKKRLIKKYKNEIEDLKIYERDILIDQKACEGDDAMKGYMFNMNNFELVVDQKSKTVSRIDSFRENESFVKPRKQSDNTGRRIKTSINFEKKNFMRKATNITNLGGRKLDFYLTKNSGELKESELVARRKRYPKLRLTHFESNIQEKKVSNMLIPMPEESEGINPFEVDFEETSPTKNKQRFKKRMKKKKRRSSKSKLSPERSDHEESRVFKLGVNLLESIKIIENEEEEKISVKEETSSSLIFGESPKSKKINNALLMSPTETEKERRKLKRHSVISQRLFLEKLQEEQKKPRRRGSEETSSPKLKAMNLNLPVYTNPFSNLFKITKPQILKCLRKIFRQEILNYRMLKVASNLCVMDKKFNKNELVCFLDQEKNGFISLKDFKTFFVRIKNMKKQIGNEDKMIQYVFWRTGKDPRSDCFSYKEFSRLFFDCFEIGEIHNVNQDLEDFIQDDENQDDGNLIRGIKRKCYNFEYKRLERGGSLDLDRRKQLAVRPSTRQVLNQFQKRRRLFRRKKTIPKKKKENKMIKIQVNKSLDNTRGKIQKKKVNWKKLKKKLFGEQKKKFTVFSTLSIESTEHNLNNDSIVSFIYSPKPKKNKKRKISKNCKKCLSITNRRKNQVKRGFSSQRNRSLPERRHRKINDKLFHSQYEGINCFKPRKQARKGSKNNLTLYCTVKHNFIKNRAKIGHPAKNKKSCNKFREFKKSLALYFRLLATCEKRLKKLRSMLRIETSQELSELVAYIFESRQKLTVFQFRDVLLKKFRVSVGGDESDIKNLNFSSSLIFERLNCLDLGTVNDVDIANMLNPSPPLNKQGKKKNKFEESSFESHINSPLRKRKDFVYSGKNQNFVKLKPKLFKTKPFTPFEILCDRVGRRRRDVIFYKPGLVESQSLVALEPSYTVMMDIRCYLETVIKFEKLFQMKRKKIAKSEFFDFDEIDMILDLKQDGFGYTKQHFYDFMRWEKTFLPFEDIEFIFERVDCKEIMGSKELERLLKVVTFDNF